MCLEKCPRGKLPSPPKLGLGLLLGLGIEGRATFLGGNCPRTIDQLNILKEIWTGLSKQKRS